jgi:glycosyltransferase involved in cell wall biosynthesis
VRILFVTHGYKPAWRMGGPAVSVPALAESLVRRGHEVTVFTTNSNLDRLLDVETNRPHEIEGVQVWYFEKTEPLKIVPRITYLAKSMGVMYSRKMAGALQSIVPTMDLVHTHLPFIYPTYAAARAAFRFDKPLFYHQRGVFHPQRLKFRAFKKRLFLRLVEIPILKRATTLVALTPGEVDTYRMLGVSTPCAVVPNGIDPDTLKPRGGYEVLERLCIEPWHTMVLFMGRVHPIKGAEKLLDAFLRVADHHRDAVLVIAGPDEFGLEASFRVRAARSSASDRVVFTGMVEGDIKKVLLERADLFCLPSDAEGFSMAILEALATRTAVIISRGCHFDEVEEAGAGRVVDATTDAMADALREMLADRAALRRMGIRGVALVQEKYSWDHVAGLLVGVYQEGVERHRARPRPKIARIVGA